MKIRSKLNGEVSNVRGDIAREMVKLGVAEILGESPDEAKARLPRPGDANVTPAFSVGHYEGRYAAIFLKVLNVTRRYTGDPRFIHNKRNHDGTSFCGSLGFPVPVEIQKQYLQLWAQSEHEPSMPGEGAAELAAFQTFGSTGISNAAMASELKQMNAQASPDPDPEVAKAIKQAEKIIAAQEWK